MIDRVGGDGGQARAAKSLNWTTSTVSRDYKGDTLPTDERLLQLCHALQLPDREMLDLAALLRRAAPPPGPSAHLPRRIPGLPLSPAPAGAAESEPVMTSTRSTPALFPRPGQPPSRACRTARAVSTRPVARLGSADAAASPPCCLWRR